MTERKGYPTDEKPRYVESLLVWGAMAVGLIAFYAGAAWWFLS